MEAGSRPGLPSLPSGGYPGGELPMFSGTVVDFQGVGNSQCGSSFYGPAYGGGVNHHGIGVGVSQPNLPQVRQTTVVLELDGRETAVFFLKP